MAFCWISNWFMQNHRLADEARRARIWKWRWSIWGPHWQRDWETLPNNDTNWLQLSFETRTSWTEIYIINITKTTQQNGKSECDSVTQEANTSSFYKKRPRRQIQAEELSSGSTSKLSFFLCAQPFPFTIKRYAHPLIILLRAFP